MRKKIAPLFIIIASLILSSAAFLYKPVAAEAPKPKNGVLDLSNWSFEENGVVSLEGTWTFYFNQFLTHEDFKYGVETSGTPIDIPSTQKSLATIKPFDGNRFYGTLRLIIKLPESTLPFGLRTNIILTSFRLYIDGNLYGGVGTAGTSRETSVPYYDVLTTYFTPENNEVELIYHTSDYTAEDCAITAPKIGLATQISREQQLGMGRDLFLFGMLLIMGIYHFGLFIMRSKDRAPLYFGIFCLLFSLRMLLVGERFLPSNLNLGFFVYGRIAYLCVFIGFAALCGFLYYTLNGLFSTWFVRAGVALGALFSLLIFSFPYRSANTLLIIYAAVGFILLSYAVVKLVIGVIKKYPLANIVLLGFTVLGFTFINDLIYEITLTNTPSLIPLGVSVFTLTQAYTLSAKFANAFTRSENLSEENASILSELKLMNSKLESLVEARTSDLQKALEEMDVMSKTDDLTKLPNRRLVIVKINDLIEQKRDFYIGLADIDHFKEINDRFGHAKGDEILICLSEILCAAIGDSGFVGRWGGEEFLIVLETTRVNTILEKADEIRAAVAEYYHEDIKKNITITIGLCKYQCDSTLNVMIANADAALYQGKAAGRNQCRMAF